MRRRAVQGSDAEVAAIDTVAALAAKVAAARASLGGSLHERTWQRCAEATDVVPERTVRVMQFNMLAEGLSARACDTPPFEAEKESTSGGFTAVPDAVCDWSVRRYLLLEKILAVDADVVALEECDHFHDFFLPLLSLHGYKGVFVEKALSPCLQFGYYSDGVAVLYKEAVFEKKGHSQITKGCTHLCLSLEHRSTQVPFIVAATHLKAKATQENEELRLEQIDGLISHVDTVWAEMQAPSEDGDTPQAPVVVVLGDFNAAPTREHDVEPRVVRRVARLTQGDAFFAPLRSAYPLAPDADAAVLPYTTAKIRGSNVTAHTIDYIWVSEATARVTATLTVPPFSELEADVLLPSVRHPSDHFDIAAEVSF
eukprot:Rhum_TRINITY_DN10644_c0_g1::Rhum_TRINITY_DN10644_c0_g1_i1::g.39450::m.39450/K18764/CCRN4L; nocturnin